MIRNRILLRSIALFFTLELVASLIVPNVVHALTSGPTAPEATSFEPVDTSDMVNLATGDLVYNIPLLEVPGPAGGYPLSLSYHAGIQTNEEASWVGLGWTLNPGAINRTVSGYPDDHNAVSGVSRVYWDGSTTHTIEAGGVLGVAGVVGVSAGLSVSHDRNVGIGVGGFLGVNIGLSGADGPLSFGVNGRVGIAPYGGIYASAGAGVGIGDASNKGLQLGVGAGVSSNFDGKGASAYGSGGVSYGYGKTENNRSRGGASLLGASISTSGEGSGRVSVGGASTLHNSRAGKLSTKSVNVTLPLPFIHLGYNYHRYWIDETEVTSTNGSLYYPTTDQGNYRTVGYDTYSLLDPHEEGGIIDHPDPDKVMGGSFSDYDSYNVNAQGLSGNIRPYFYKRYLARQSKYDEDKGHYDLRHVNLGYNYKKPYFRFVGDFSNTYEYDENSTDWFNTSNDLLSYGFNGNYFAGLDGNSSTGVNGEGFDRFTDELAGSRDIEYYTNGDILSVDDIAKQNGFIENSCAGFTRSKIGTLADQIGGFKIINSSGVNYHYSLPVYSFHEYQKSTNTETGAYNTSSKSGKYAYTWFLTGVTGPDYVDRNNNGLLDDGDWGYWVSFDYEKWVNDFQWRIPAEGFHKDVDSRFESYSRGRKEIYYLKKISTTTHHADFITSERLDGREVGSLSEGGFNKYTGSEFDDDCYHSCLESCGGGCESVCESSCTKEINGPRPLKKLDKIVLKNQEGQTIRAVKLNHDYSLAQGTPNSFEYNTPEIKFGKLTLNKLQFLGKNEASILPATNFEYEKNHPYDKDNFDHWGLFKVVDKNLLGTNENIARLVKAEDSNVRDTWSLNKITSPMGSSIKISYESDSYKVELATQNILRLYDAYIEGGELIVKYLDEGIDLNPYLKADEMIDLALVGSYYRYTSRIVDSSPSYDLAYVKDMAEKCLMDFHLHPQLFSLKDLSLISIDEASSTLKFNINTPLDGITSPYYWSKFNQGCTVEYKIDKVKFQTPNNWPDYIVGGTLYLPKNVERNGGGLRVTNIEVNTIGDKRSTQYTYAEGITSYEPWSVITPYINPDYSSQFGTRTSKKLISKSILEAYSDLLGNSREIVSPGVVYKKVKIEEYINSNKIPGYTEYVFQPFERNMIDIIPEDKDGGPGGTYDGITFSAKKTKKITVDDKMSQIGSVKSVTFYDDKGQKIAETINHYLHDYSTDIKKTLKESFKNQGMIEETFVEATIVRRDSGDYKQFGVLSQRRHYPNIQVGQTNINYKTGLKTITDNLAYDFFSGQITKTGTTDSYGNYIIHESTPAYRKYENMGLALNGGKNMLTQEAQNINYQYKGNKQILNSVRIHPPGGMEGPGWYAEQLNASPAVLEPGIYIKFPHQGRIYVAKVIELTRTSPDLVGSLEFEEEIPGATVDFEVDTEIYTEKGLLSASVQTWSDQIASINDEGNTIDQPDIWRNHRSYTYSGGNQLKAPDQGTPFAEYSPFIAWNPNDPVPSDDWQKTSEITLFDVNSHALEASDVNDQYVATKFDLKQEKIMATASNSRHKEFGYLGMEEDVAPSEFSFTNLVESFFAHSGDRSLEISAGTTGFTFYAINEETKDYYINFWINESNLADVSAYYQLHPLGIGEISEPVNVPLNISNSRCSEGWCQGEAVISIQNNGSPQKIALTFKNVGTSLPLYIDDFRFHPFDASMTSYVYNHWDELEYILDDRNMYTRFEYDFMGRLIKTHRESFAYGEKLASRVDYNYGRKTIDKYDELSADFTYSAPQYVNEPITFSVQQGNVAGTTNYIWDFGDGSPIVNTTSTNVTHTFDYVGYKKVFLEVSNPEYGKKAVTKDVNIEGGPLVVDVCAEGYTTYNTCTNDGTSLSDPCSTQPPNYQETRFIASVTGGCSDYMYDWYMKTGVNGNWEYYGMWSTSDPISLTTPGEYYIYVDVLDGCANSIYSKEYSVIVTDQC